MTLNEYQDEAQCFCPVNFDLTMLAMSLAEESGEVIALIRKALRDGKPMNIGLLTQELGDVLWNVAMLADRLDLELDIIARKNLAAMDSRGRKAL